MMRMVLVDKRRHPAKVFPNPYSERMPNYHAIYETLLRGEAFPGCSPQLVWTLRGLQDLERALKEVRG